MKTRQGYDVYFPPTEYVVIMEIVKKGTNYTNIQKQTKINNNLLGVKLSRMIDAGLIERPEYGVYKTTEYGSKVMKAYEKYLEVMKA